MKLLNTFLKKISKQNFSKLYKSLGTFNLIASNLSNNDDIFNALYVLAFDEIPNTKFTVKESITRKSDAKEQLNLVEKHIIAKEVLKSFEDKDSVYDSELENHVKVDANFKQPTDAFLVKIAKFGTTALVGNKCHLVNPLTNKVTAEYVDVKKEAAPTVPFADSDNEIVYENADYVITLNTMPTIPENIGDTAAFYTIKSNLGKGTRGGIVGQCVVVVNENGYALKGLKRYPEELEPSKLSEDTLMEAYSIVQKDYESRSPEANKSVNASAKVTAKVDFDKLLKNRTFKDANDLENTIKSFVAGGKVLEDDADGFTIEALEEDGKHTYKVYLIGNGGPSEEVIVEKIEELTSQEEKPVVEKKAEDGVTAQDEKAQAVKQLTGEDAELTEWTTYGLPTYKSGDEEYAVASNEQEVYNAVVEEIESILDDAGYDSFNWNNMGGIENFVNTDWFEDARQESNEFYARDIAESEPERFKEEAKEYGITVGEDIDEDAIDAFAEKMKENQEKNPVEWFVNNFGKEAIRDLIKEDKITFDTHAIADEVINLDGAGHVLSIYDGNEVEQQVNGKTYFLYRQAKKQDGLNKKADATDLSFDEAMQLEPSDPRAVEYLAKNFNVKPETAKEILNAAETVSQAYDRMDRISNIRGYGWDTNPDSDVPTMQQVLDSSEENIEKNSAKKKTPEWMVKLPKEMVKKIQDSEYLVQKDSEEFKALSAIPGSLTQDMFDENLFHATSPSVIAKYQSFMTVDASEEGTIKIYSGDHFIGTCKTIQAAFEELEKNAGESYGWYVDPREAQEKLDLWIEAVGAEKALDDLRYALNTDELSECLAFIFRNNDFKEGCSDAYEDSYVESAKKENIEKKADEELKQFDMKQELDGQKEFEKQDDFSQVSVPEEKEDTSEVTETMEAKPEAPKGESFSASEFGNNLAYIQQNNPDSFSKIMNNLKQLMVGDEKNIYNFLENWSKRNFQDFTAMTREDPTYARHSQYQEQLKNNVLPKLKEMSEYKQAMEEKVSAEKGNVEASKNEDIEVNADGQNYTSRNTSLNQIPALHRKVKWNKDTVNFDNGAGKFDRATNYLKDLGVNNVRFDPYNLPDEINNQSNDYIGKCDTSTLANVLNVIDDENSQIEALQKSKDMLKPGGKLYISVYEGNGSGVGAQSKEDCWQNNKKLRDYVDTVKKVFEDVEQSNGMLVATKETSDTTVSPEEQVPVLKTQVIAPEDSSVYNHNGEDEGEDINGNN